MPDTATLGERTESRRVISPNSAEKVLTVLLAFAPDSRPKGVSELARLTGFSKSTTHRMLTALSNFDLVQHEDGRYRPGPALLLFAALLSHGSTDDPCYDELRSVVNRLASRTGSGAGFWVQTDRKARCAVSSTNAMGPRRAPLHDTAVGKVLLAYSDETLQESVLAGISPSGPALRAELQRIREQGVAVERRPDTPRGFASVAVPVLIRGRELVGALSVEVDPMRLPLADVVPILRRAAALASAVVENPTPKPRTADPAVGIRSVPRRPIEPGPAPECVSVRAGLTVSTNSREGDGS
ncbi:IclR family transcriptional regulator [Streptomyces sp. NPDC056632]|uniref:IclR family transcriptional regulator n=1 Tax=Streptomyces sp. NPDC056632 TaxID=3345884 RepID=UPI0036C500A8